MLCLLLIFLNLSGGYKLVLMH